MNLRANILLQDLHSAGARGLADSLARLNALPGRQPIFISAALLRSPVSLKGGLRVLPGSVMLHAGRDAQDESMRLSSEDERFADAAEAAEQAWSERHSGAEEDDDG